MGYQEGGFPLLTDDAADVRGHRQTGLKIQGRKRLIQQQDLGIRRHGADKGAALAHTTGELGGTLLGKIPQAVAPEQGVGVGQSLGGALPGYGKPQGHIVPDGAPGKKLIPLGHEADFFGGAADRSTVHLHGTGGELFQPGYNGQERGFATAGGPHHAAEFPRGDVHIHPAQSLHLAVGRLIDKGRAAKMNHLICLLC